MSDEETPQEQGEERKEAQEEAASSQDAAEQDTSTDETKEGTEEGHTVSEDDVIKAGTEALDPSILDVDNIGRVLDVNLELIVKIGNLKMKLKDVLDLHPGAIIEVDKNADAPLDLQIGNKALTKGEVVTIGENLGIRIKK